MNGHVCLVIFDFLINEKNLQTKGWFEGYRYQHRDIDPKNIDYGTELKKYNIAHHSCSLVCSHVTRTRVESQPLLFENFLLSCRDLIPNVICMWIYRQKFLGFSPDCFVAGLLRLKGNIDPTPELEEMKREKEEADREPKVSVFSLVRIGLKNTHFECCNVGLQLCRTLIIATLSSRSACSLRSDLLLTAPTAAAGCPHDASFPAVLRNQRGKRETLRAQRSTSWCNSSIPFNSIQFNKT